MPSNGLSSVDVAGATYDVVLPPFPRAKAVLVGRLWATSETLAQVAALGLCCPKFSTAEWGGNASAFAEAVLDEALARGLTPECLVLPGSELGLMLLRMIPRPKEVAQAADFSAAGPEATAPGSGTAKRSTSGASTSATPSPSTG